MSEEVSAAYTKLVKEMICLVEQPLDLVVVRRFFLLMCRAHFSYASNYGPFYSERLAGLTYDAENENNGTSLAILLSHAFVDNKDANQRPAIYVHVAGEAYSQQVLGSFGGANPDLSGAYVTDKAKCAIKLWCIHDDIDISASLAIVAANFFRGMRESIKRLLHPESFFVNGVSEAYIETKRPDKYFSHEVLMQLEYDSTILWSEESHRLKKVTLDITPTV